MWTLVNLQLSKARSAFLNFDKDLAREVVLKEKRVNGSELKIDRDCENIFALFCPVAIDLRFLLAVLKINTNLERIRDIAEAIAKYVIDAEAPFSREMLRVTRILPMYDGAVSMLEDTQTAFEREDTVLARSIFKQDDLLDDVNRTSIKVLEKHLNARRKIAPQTEGLAAEGNRRRFETRLSGRVSRQRHPVKCRFHAVCLWT